MKRKTDNSSIHSLSVQPGLYDRIYTIVRLIPYGRVATYGQIARLAGLHGQARLVGYALHNLSSEFNVPWHRVINRRGRISLAKSMPDSASLQRNLLELEGIQFGAEGSIDLKRYQWHE